MSYVRLSFSLAKATSIHPSPLKSAAAASVAYSLVVAMIIYRELKIKDLGKVLLGSAKTSAMIMFIIANGILFTFVLAAGAASAAGPLDCAAEPTRTGYYFTAEPISATTGRRGFATSQRGTIWQDSTGALPTEPFAISATVGPLDTQ